jgi:hypothetical protein
VLEALGVRSLLDAPCGDFNWMQSVRLPVERYIGVDVLREVIAQNEWRHVSAQRSFTRADLTQQQLPLMDAILCRDLLTHLPFADIFAVLANFKRSGATYLLTTTFTGARQNRESSGGDWRTLNLTAPLVERPAKHGLESMMTRRRFKVFVLIPLAIDWIHRMSWIGCDVDQVPTFVESVGDFFRSPA